LAALLLCGALAAPSYAQDNKSTLLKAAHGFIIPRYEVLARATKTQQEAWTQFCAAPQTGSVDALKDSYHKAADAWSGIEFVLYGPISVDFRFERMAHWPERKNAIGRALNNLLSRTGSDDLTPERFSQVSAAAQGLTAIERLLYEQKSTKALGERTDAGERSCAVGQAIATGLARTSAAVLDEWTGPAGALVRLERGEAGTTEEAVTRLVTDYLTLFEIIEDQKLGAVMGKEPDEARPTLAEGWRSGRSVRAIAVNLEAAEALARILVDETEDENSSLFYAFQSSRGLAEGLRADIGTMAADPKQRRNLALLHDSIHSLREIVGSVLPSSLGVSVGFNSRDGD
jgi:predicted lipoprotein